MHFKILGSGGCTAIPRPCCFCPICNEAREKGMPYSRSSCCLYITDINYVVDTPEDINYSLNKNNIKTVSGIFYSHWDPDHTLGMRVIEQLRLNWFKFFNNQKCTNPLPILMLDGVYSELHAIQNKYGAYIDYYSSLNLCKVSRESSFKINNLDISLIPIKTNITSTAFIFKENNKKVVYAPCDNKPFPDAEELYNADIAILGGYIPTDGFKDGTILTLDNKIYEAMYTIEELIELKNKYNYKKLILTHLEEDWGKSFDQYNEISNKLKDHSIIFAYDGMDIIL